MLTLCGFLSFLVFLLSEIGDSATEAASGRHRIRHGLLELLQVNFSISVLVNSLNEVVPDGFLIRVYVSLRAKGRLQLIFIQDAIILGI